MRPILAAILVTLALPAAAQASSLKLVQGVLTYTDTTSSDTNAVTIALSPDGSRITVTEAGKTARSRPIPMVGDANCPASGSAGSCPAGSVTSISVDTGGANDVITQATALPSRLAGGAGDDTITGGAGDDVFPEDAGADTLKGGAGRDTADYSSATSAVAISLDDQPGDGAAGENDNVGADIEVVKGGGANDVLTGNAADNELDGNGGDDTLSGGAGNDSLDGGAGNDSQSGGDGNDHLTGGDGNDQLAGGEGDDSLAGGAGADALTGNGGVDTATYADSPQGVRVVLDGKPGDGAPGENDNVDAENVVGSPGDDVLIGNAGPNALAGGTGNDRILGGRGADYLNGGTGDDVIEALDGAKDYVVCGDGEDGVVTDRRDARADCDYIKYRTLAATSTRLHLSDGYVRAPVRCSPAVAERCGGRLYLRVGRTTIGSLRFQLTPGRRWVARVKLTRAGRRTVRSRRVTTATLSVHDRQAIPTAQTIRIAR